MTAKQDIMNMISNGKDEREFYIYFAEVLDSFENKLNSPKTLGK